MYYGNPISTDGTWAINLVKFGDNAAQQSGNTNFLDHSIFLEQYFDRMVALLKSYDNSNHTLAEYRMAMLFGLNNPGDEPAYDPNEPYKVFIYSALKDKLLILIMQFLQNTESMSRQ